MVFFRRFLAVSEVARQSPAQCPPGALGANFARQRRALEGIAPSIPGEGGGTARFAATRPHRNSSDPMRRDALIHDGFPIAVLMIRL